MIRTLLITICTLYSISTVAQSSFVRGTVTAKDDGLPMIGVNIVVKGTTRGTSTDVDGNYSIELSPGEDTLLFSYLGYTTQPVAVTGREVLDVILSPDVEILDDVVVIGYG